MVSVYTRKHIELCNAVGEFTTIDPTVDDCLPFPKEQMNFVIMYDEDIEDVESIRKDLTRIYPNRKLELPRTKPKGRVFKATASGARSAIIDSSQFDEEVVIGGEKATGIKIKGCRILSLPPIPSPHAPERRDGLHYYPEMFTAYMEDGTEVEALKDQPWGMTVEDAKNEAVMSLFAHDLKIPTNVAGLGIGSYSNVIYPGNFVHAEDPKEGQMGTAVLALFGIDERVSELILNMRIPPDSREPNISGEEARTILKNFHQLSEELNVNYYELFNDIIFHKSGEILDKMHSYGIIHGPRQSHYVNYTRPTKEYKSLKVCDFESSLLVKHLTDIQALKYMRDDLWGLTSAAHRLYLVVIKSVEKGFKCKTMPEGFDAEEMLIQLVKREPVDGVLQGYTNGEIGLEDLKGYEPCELEYKVIETTKKDRLQSIRDSYSKLFEKLRKT